MRGVGWIGCCDGDSGSIERERERSDLGCQKLGMTMSSEFMNIQIEHQLPVYHRAPSSVIPFILWLATHAALFAQALIAIGSPLPVHYVLLPLPGSFLACNGEPAQGVFLGEEGGGREGKRKYYLQAPFGDERCMSHRLGCLL